MHTDIKLFDFSAQGSVGNIDKFALKLPGKNEVINKQTASEFLKIMGAMMTLDPEQVRASLDQFETVALEGAAAGGFAPLIDLASDADEPGDMVALLLGKPAHGQVSPEAEAIDEEDCCPSADLGALGQTPVVETTVPSATTSPVKDGVTVETGVSESAHTANAATTGISKAQEVVNPHAFKSQVFGNQAPETPRESIPEMAQQALGSATSSQTERPNETADVKNPVIADRLAVAGNAKTGTQAFNDKTVAQTPEIQATITEKSGKSFEQGSTTLQNAKSTETASHKDVQADAAFQAAATGEPAKPVRKDRMMAATAQTTSTVKAAAGAVPPQAGMEAIKSAMAEPVKVEPDAARSTAFAPTTETEDGLSLNSNNPGDGETVQRAPAGRDGFQSMMSRFDTHTVKDADAVATERVASESSKQLQKDVMRQIVQRMALRTQGSKSKMQIQLKPEFLGNVHMHISTENQQVAVRMTAESVVVKEMIEQHLSFLKSELQQHGLEIDKFEVHVGSDSEGHKSSQDPSGFRQALKNGQQRQTDGQKRDAPEEKNDATDDEKRKNRQHTNEIDYFA